MGGVSDSVLRCELSPLTTIMICSALKLRYMVPIGPLKSSQGSTPVVSPSPSQQSFPSIENMLFDPQLVAKREEGWDTMLETAVFKWMWCVVGERRGGK